MGGKTRGRGDDVAPDQRKLTAIQAARLGSLAGIDKDLLVGLTVNDVRDKFGWQVDARLLLFRRICGRVVKKDPVTGQSYPVPFATVHVEDTDCHLISYFPQQWPWGWFFPFHCHRETLATVKTDRCGNFCVWVPRFEIDWILHWRKARICFPDIFIRPSLRDLLPFDPTIPERGPFPPRPGPGPDPAPFTRLAAFSNNALQGLTGDAARGLTDRLVRLHESRAFGAPAADIDAIANARAFDNELPPPLPVEFRKALGQGVDVKRGDKAVDPVEGIRTAVGLHLQRSGRDLQHFDPRRYVGPFLRCRDVLIPEWHLISDVPDITFRVTQDVDGDGDEEVIYSEGFFDVRWNAGAIPDVTLVANDLAVASQACDVPVVPCGNVPAIVFAGLHPLDDISYFDNVEGYATRPNRPQPGGPRPPAKTPFCGTLQLYGCVNLPGAVYYRVLRSTDNGATFAPITNLPRVLHPAGGGAPVIETPADGWYTVLANPADWHPARMLIEWPTPSIGKNVLKVETGDGAKTPLAASAPVSIQVDNTAPNITYNKLSWRFVGEADSAFDLPGRNLLVPCPVIRRGSPAQDIEVQFEATVSAAHLRNAYIYSSGCGGGAFSLVGSAPNHTSHWHTDVNDNSELLYGRYALSSGALEGCYGFNAIANSRAMNPAGSDNGHLVDWIYDPVYIYSHPGVSVSVVNG
ncbi:MAG: hypothetical protein IT361_04915 [Gemmatimonadaceae bacterium]|nr:hypothetical protein [Gemmatimonadaceae bacterium]